MNIPFDEINRFVGQYKANAHLYRTTGRIFNGKRYEYQCWELESGGYRMTIVDMNHVIARIAF